MTALLPDSPWSLIPADEQLVEGLSASVGLSATTARILVSRGLTTADDVARFFSPSLQRDWLDPDLIPGMSAAADAVAQTVRDGEHILIFGDFDLDGISSTAVAARGLSAMGAHVSAVVPHRFNEGYGLSAAAIERILPLDPKLIVTVDCGISAAAEVALLAEKGVRVVITDHHEPGGLLPRGVPVADPKLDPAGCASQDLAGAGVALKLVQAVGARLGFPDVWRDLTDLATLGTVADIVPLTAENRALVADGVARMRTQTRPSIAALAAVANVSLDVLAAESVAFALAPRLNAAGRMADPQIALDLLLADEPVRAESLSRALDELNRARQATEADLADAALAMAERVYRGERALVLAGEGWHEGVKGIVASRLATRFGVPTVLFAVEDGVALGSGRSVGHVDLFRALDACGSVLTRFGGHAAAAGCALPAEDVERFTECLLAHLDTLPAEQFATERTIDAMVELGDVSVELGAELAQLEPFGHGNRQPMLAVGGVFMNGRQRVGKQGTHMRFVAFDGAVSAQAIAFRCPDIDRLLGHEAAVDLAFELSVDEWRGRKRAQMRVQDILAHEPSADAPAFELVEDLFARADEILAREEYSGIAEAPSFHTKLAGVTFEGRQDTLERVSAGTPLRLVRQPDNPYDANACALFDPHGDQVGFLNRRLAAALAPSIDAGIAYDIEVTDVTGGDGGRSLGVNVLVSRRDAAESDVERETLRVGRRAELAELTPEELDAELTKCFIGERSLHPAQAQSLAHLSAGESTLTVMATGRGKSLIFHLHAARTALRHARSSVFVYPLRALVSDQAHHLGEAFAEVGLTVKTITGESSHGERDEAFAELGEGRLDVVLTTPEFLHLYANRFAASGRIGFLVVDEAHHVGQSRAGHRPVYGRLGETLEMLGAPTVLAVTATADDTTADAIRASLGISATVLDPTVRENLVIEDRRGIADRDAYIRELVARHEKTVVYVNSREQTVKLARMLRKTLPDLAMRTAFYNGGMSRQMRHAVERAFRGGELDVIIATSAFGEGVNIPDIRNVVLYHLPFGSVEFNQMAGRAGRDGAIARIHLLFGERDARINETILSSLAPQRDDMAALYVVLRDISAAEGAGFEISNAELAQRCKRARRECALDDRGVSSALGILRDLGFVAGEGHGAYRRLTFTSSQQKVNLSSSVRYAEGADEIAEFQEFKTWVFSVGSNELLVRFNRPILPRG
jgi:single-stranded-DNA-specific exonuclease